MRAAFGIGSGTRVIGIVPARLPPAELFAAFGLHAGLALPLAITNTLRRVKPKTVRVGTFLVSTHG
jgi:hypothetical protein